MNNNLFPGFSYNGNETKAQKATDVKTTGTSNLIVIQTQSLADNRLKAIGHAQETQIIGVNVVDYTGVLVAVTIQC